MSAKKIASIILICFGILSYSNRFYSHESVTALNKISIDSDVCITRTKNIDSNQIVIFGNIQDKEFAKIDALNSELGLANIRVKNIHTDSIINTISKLEGDFEIYLSPSTYEIRIDFVAYNSIIVRNLEVTYGDVFEVKANLGIGNGITTYVWTSEGLVKRLID
ncbi:carboxypeptidase-like regulatory domain-containing protein [Flavobacteriaceae bacterium M23B6Z8]